MACSTSGPFGPYFLTNGADWLFGIANETHATPDQTLYLAFDDAYVLHVKRGLVLPELPTESSPVFIDNFTSCDDPTSLTPRWDPVDD